MAHDESSQYLSTAYTRMAGRTSRAYGAPAISLFRVQKSYFNITFTVHPRRPPYTPIVAINTHAHR